MTEIINNPGTTDSGGPGLMIGLVLGIIVVALFFIYGLPALRNKDQSGTQVKINVPTTQPAPTPTPAPTP